MATGGDPMDAHQSFDSEGGGQQLTFPDQYVRSSDETDTSLDALLNLIVDSLLNGASEEVPPLPDTRETEVNPGHSESQNIISLPPSLDSLDIYVVIIEQPAPRRLRFRYECEIDGRSPGCLVGVRSSSTERTYPTIQVVNYRGPFVVIVTCVTRDGPPYWPHPHKLVGNEGCRDGGFCSVLVNNTDMTYSFTSLGIQCVRRRDINASLEVRQQLRIDPYDTGFNYPENFDLSVLRLCFQVFIRGANQSCSVPLAPVVSEPIYDKKAISDLRIVKLSRCSGPATGNTEIILLCDRVSKNDIEILFYEYIPEVNNFWFAKGEFHTEEVHRNYAISFRTPAYRRPNIRQPVTVSMQLKKPSDGTMGEPRDFTYWPVDTDPEGIEHKKRKFLRTENPELRELAMFPDYPPSPADPPQQPQGFQVPRTYPTLRRTRVRSRVGQNPNEDPFSQSSTSSFNLTSVPSSSRAVYHRAIQLTQAHSPSSTTQLGWMPRPTRQPVMRQTASPQPSSIDDSSVAATAERLHNLDLDEDISDILSSSLFDSILNIPDSAYEDDS